MARKIRKSTSKYIIYIYIYLEILQNIKYDVTIILYIILCIVGVVLYNSIIRMILIYDTIYIVTSLKKSVMLIENRACVRCRCC
jgi:hypothetical protein